MSEQFHSMNVLLDVVTMCTIHYGCDCDCRYVGLIGCHVSTHVLDQVSFLKKYIGPGLTFEHI